MNGRTCQLCGKALSRFTVGSGGDFCSREHRNQFRLRLGMDRLMEANKVASLMRRRENAKAIPSALLARDSKVSPRVSPVLRMPVRQPDAYAPRPLPAALGKTAIASRSENLLSTPPPATMRAEVRSIKPPSFNVRLKRPFLPPRTDGFQARMAPAGVLVQRLTGASVAQLRRAVTELRLNLHRTHIGGNGIQVRPLRVPAQDYQEPQMARRLNNSADRGRELRVSGGIGFRLPSPRIRTVEFAKPRINAPVRSTEPHGLTACSQPKKSTTVSAGVIRFAIRLPAPPTTPKEKNGAAFLWPDALLNGAEPLRQASSVTRICKVRWSGPAPCAPQLRHDNGVVRLRTAAPQVLSLSAPEARSIQSARRLTLVEFRPEETPFECPTALHGTLLSSMHSGAGPVRKVDPAPATLEEHFDAGLHNWVGGTDDWKVDVAGVRPGSLALYSPSLEIPNCLLEFLTRIELRGITWVFRASNFTDYYKISLALAPGGGYEFRRHAVIGGLAEGASVRLVPPASPAPSGKTAVTVRTRVAGNEFTVSLDGQAIDTWNDARLTAGGIGFVGAPEERARLYWVKVTPIGHTSKEYSNR